MPPARVSPYSTSFTRPSSQETTQGFEVSVWTPQISTSGFSAFAAMAMPFISPPPPAGTSSSSISGSSVNISKPAVPCPATTATSSKEET